MRWMDLRKLDRAESVQLRFRCKQGVLNQVRRGFNFWTLLAKQWCSHQGYKEDGKPWYLNGSVKIERIHKRKCLSQQGWKDGRQCHWWWQMGSQQVCQCPDLKWQGHLASSVSILSQQVRGRWILPWKVGKAICLHGRLVALGAQSANEFCKGSSYLSC